MPPIARGTGQNNPAVPATAVSLSVCSSYGPLDDVVFFLSPQDAPGRSLSSSTRRQFRDLHRLPTVPDLSTDCLRSRELDTPPIWHTRPCVQSCRPNRASFRPRPPKIIGCRHTANRLSLLGSDVPTRVRSRHGVIHAMLAMSQTRHSKGALCHSQRYAQSPRAHSRAASHSAMHPVPSPERYVALSTIQVGCGPGGGTPMIAYVFLLPH